MNTNRYPEDMNAYDEYDAIDDVGADEGAEDFVDMYEGDETEKLLDKYGYRHAWSGLHIDSSFLLRTSTGRAILCVEADATNADDNPEMTRDFFVWIR